MPTPSSKQQRKSSRSTNRYNTGSRRSTKKKQDGNGNDDGRSYEDDIMVASAKNHDEDDCCWSDTYTIADASVHTATSTVGGTMMMERDLDWDVDNNHDDDAVHGDRKASAVSETKRQERLQCILGTALDFPHEKRSAKREQLLKQWFKALTQYATIPPYDVVYQYREAVLEACLQHTLMKGSRSSSSFAEQYAACRVLEVVSVLLQTEDVDVLLYEPSSVVLRRTVLSTHRANSVRCAALRALGMIAFCVDDEDEGNVVESVMDICEEVILESDERGQQQPTPKVLKAAAFQVWTVLATTLPVLYVSGKDDVMIGRGLPLLSSILHSLDLEDTDEATLQLKEAAGQAVVYVHDARLNLGSADAGNITDVQYKLGSWEGTEYEEVMEEITQLVYQLAHTSGHYLSKKAKKEQRHVFRDYLSLLQDQEDPVQQHLTIQSYHRGSSLAVTTWRDVIVMDYLRRCLQGGFQIQLMTNPSLQAMLGANHGGPAQQNGEGGDRYSQIEKRLLWSKTSEVAKSKDKERHKGRDKRNNVKNHFLTADTDGI